VLQEEGYIRYETLLLETSGVRVDVDFVSNVYAVDGEKVIRCNIRDVTARWIRRKLAQELSQAQVSGSNGWK
jgi:hypothetical protein